MKRNLVVDYVHENASLQIFPRKPLISVNKANWSNIKLEYHELPPYEVQEHSSKQNTFVILHQPAKQVKRRLGGTAKNESAKAADVVFCPKGVPHSAVWDENVSFSLLFLEPKFFDNVACEASNQNGIELVPHFAQPDPIIYGIGQALRFQSQHGESVSQLYLDSIASFMASHLLENYCSKKHKLVESTHFLPDKDLREVFDYIQSHLDQKIGMADLANLVAMSNGHFSRVFKKSTGSSPAKYVIERRLEKAIYLLTSTNSNLEVIAKQTGFSSQNHLCRAFQQHFALSPCKYRKML
jgi:AraC family transcriptional regulator